ncbi:MAG: bifunctional fucokinase/L-fucose-1-P-guanylyltransferase [Bacteroidaceae bacterium]|nr:bifunctional fucokinase/L-fucose-1-P-guanylyltransferase [Bacteroidaceae bacterium]
MPRVLLSLPPSLVACAHEVASLDPHVFFCASDPVGHRVGSGGGTVHLLHEAARDEVFALQTSPQTERCIVIHAGGQSRRLPAYAPSGKLFTPMPSLLGEPFGQTLLQLQLPLYERIMNAADASSRVLIASGDVCITAAETLEPLPAADIVCYGLPTSHEQMSHHGVYAMSYASPTQLDFMLQKPSVQQLETLTATHTLLMDIGIWLLSEKALRLLAARSTDADGNICSYDLYGQFGCSVGQHPSIADAELAGLTVCILPLPEGRFLHFGTTRELLSSTATLIETPNPQMQWVENSDIEGWTLTDHNVVTGVPGNDWRVTLQPNQCVDVVPITFNSPQGTSVLPSWGKLEGGFPFALRPYGFFDTFSGSLSDPNTTFLGQPVTTWLQIHGLSPSDFEHPEDIQRANLFPVTADHGYLGRLLRWMLEPEPSLNSLYLSIPRLSAEEISTRADLRRLVRQRAEMRRRQMDVEAAFSHLRLQLAASSDVTPQVPSISALQHTVEGRSPLRIDVSGGWTDTPPYCLYQGGAVVNVAIDLDGEPPIRCTIRPLPQPVIHLRSLDMQQQEIITSWHQLQDFAHLGSAFSISKAALSLAGWLPRFCGRQYASLQEQLGGRGFELITESLVPTGSGLGTSSILAATVLGTISEAFALGWSREEICQRTLVLEQLLTAGGGWQDQYGGVFPGAKILTTEAGYAQRPQVQPLPDTLWSHPQLAPCHLLYFTGLTRMARKILAEIVKDMFLRDTDQQNHLHRMKNRARELAATLQASPSADPQALLLDFGQRLAQNWQDNQHLDAGCNPPAIQAITDIIRDLCVGFKLPGAGGGGFLYMVARSPEAAQEIRRRLTENPPAPAARFYELSINHQGFTIV